MLPVAQIFTVSHIISAITSSKWKLVAAVAYDGYSSITRKVMIELLQAHMYE